MNFRLSEEPKALGVEWSELSVQGFGDVAGTLEREVCFVVSSRWMVSDLSGVLGSSQC